jgi:nucleoside phosphorylase
MGPRSRADFAIAIICALPLEADAVEALFDEPYDRLGKFYGKQPGDANAYINGRIGSHDIVLCYMLRMGKGSAASVASSLRVSYTGVQIALVVGICGGVPYPSDGNDAEIFLGDVIISDAVVEYDFGRQYPSGFQRKMDGHKDMLGGPHREIRTLLAGLKGNRTRNEFEGQMSRQFYGMQQLDARWRRPDGLKDILFEASYSHKHYIQNSAAMCHCFNGDSPDDICEEAREHSCDSLGCDRNQVRRCRGADTTRVSLHIGKVASADTVMKSGEHRDQISRKEKVIGFEMEGAGVWDNIPCIIIKGVCDYADSHKNKKWQDYAAATAACGLKVFLEYYKIGQYSP